MYSHGYYLDRSQIGQKPEKMTFIREYLSNWWKYYLGLVIGVLLGFLFWGLHI
jgi:hypothetical protein